MRARIIFDTSTTHTVFIAGAKTPSVTHCRRVGWVTHRGRERETHTRTNTEQGKGEPMKRSRTYRFRTGVYIYSRERTHAIPERFFLPLAVSRVRWLSRRKPPAAAAVRYCPNLFLAVTVILPRLSGLLGYLLRNAPLLLEILCRSRRPVLFGFFFTLYYIAVFFLVFAKFRFIFPMKKYILVNNK